MQRGESICRPRVWITPGRDEGHNDATRLAELRRAMQGRASIFQSRVGLGPSTDQGRNDIRRRADLRRRMHGRASMFLPRNLPSRLLKNPGIGLFS